MTTPTPPSKDEIEAAKDYLDDRQELYQREAVNQVLNGNTPDAVKWEEEAKAIRTILSALASAEARVSELERQLTDASVRVGRSMMEGASEGRGIEVFSRDECVFMYCPTPEFCEGKCAHPRSPTTTYSEVAHDRRSSVR